MEQIKRLSWSQQVSVTAIFIFHQSSGCQNCLLPQQDQQCIRHTQTPQNIQYPPLSPSTTSLTADDFPTTFKQARVTPLLKKPTLDTSLVESYIPISLLPFIAKSLEHIVFNQVLSFFSQNKLLDNNQSGFKSGHLTETALLSVTEALPSARAKFKSSVIILLDLSAAFDTVNHQILLSTLIAGHYQNCTLLLWVLLHRLVFQGVLGRRGLQITSTGHWGSVLGPLLFSIQYLL